MSFQRNKRLVFHEIVEAGEFVDHQVCSSHGKKGERGYFDPQPGNLLIIGSAVSGKPRASRGIVRNLLHRSNS